MWTVSSERNTLVSSFTHFVPYVVLSSPVAASFGFKQMRSLSLWDLTQFVRPAAFPSSQSRNPDGARSQLGLKTHVRLRFKKKSMTVNTSFTCRGIEFPPIFSITAYPQFSTSDYCRPRPLRLDSVYIVISSFDLKTMEFVPTEPGMPDSVDPFADPLFDMGFPNFPVVKISNVSSSVQSATELFKFTRHPSKRPPKPSR